MKTKSLKKILFLGKFNDYPYEGFMKILKSLKEGLKGKYDISTNDSTEDPDLINIHSAGVFEAIKKRNSVPTIYSLHSNFLVRPWDVLRGIYERYKYFIWFKDDPLPLSVRIIKIIFSLSSSIMPIWMKRLLLKKYDTMVVPNNYLKKKLNMKNIEVIPHGINNCFFNKKRRGEKLSVAYIGHLSTAKGLIETVQAFSQIKKIEKNLYLTKNTKKFQAFVKYTDASIKMQGVLKNIQEAYLSNEIVVLPYRHIGGAIATPLVLIEAMASGCAIITTELPHIQEICGNSVLYIKPRSEKELVEKINFLINNPAKRKKLQELAKSRAKSFTEEKMITEYDNLYKKMLKK